MQLRKKFDFFLSLFFFLDVEDLYSAKPSRRKPKWRGDVFTVFLFDFYLVKDPTLPNLSKTKGYLDTILAKLAFNEFEQFSRPLIECFRTQFLAHSPVNTLSTHAPPFN